MSRIIPIALTELMNAVRSGNVDTVRTLIPSCVDVNSRDDTGKTMLMIAASKGHEEIVELLVNAGANIHARDKNSPLWIIHYGPKIAKPPPFRSNLSGDVHGLKLSCLRNLIEKVIALNFRFCEELEALRVLRIPSHFPL